MWLIYITIWGVSLLAGISALWALGWSVQRGDFRQGRAQAMSIFDADDALRQSKPTQTLSTRGDSTVAARPSAALVRPRLAAEARLWAWLAACWGVGGALLFGVAWAREATALRQACRDAWGMGFAGSAAGALWAARLAGSWAARLGEVFTLAAAFWSAAALALLAGQLLVGAPWIWRGPPMALSLAAGAGCLAALGWLRWAP